MPKVMTAIGLAVSGLVGLIFLLDLVLGIPFGRVSFLMDILSLVAAAALGFISWTTFREVK